MIEQEAEEQNRREDEEEENPEAARISELEKEIEEMVGKYGDYNYPRVI